MHDGEMLTQLAIRHWTNCGALSRHLVNHEKENIQPVNLTTLIFGVGRVKIREANIYSSHSNKPRRTNKPLSGRVDNAFRWF